MGTEIVLHQDEDARGTAVAHPREQVGGLMRPIAPPDEILSAQEATREMVGKALQKGRDYDAIPGTGTKPVLLKPGAERVASAFGCGVRFRIVEQEVDHDREVEWTKRTRKGTFSGTSRGLYRYVLECELVHRGSGVVIGSAIGSASTMESKYVDRPRDLENTVLKMAEKRALVAAVLVTFGLSEQFTQDVEDLGAAAETEAEAATAEQVTLIGKMIQSSTLTAKERDGIAKRLATGMSKEQASGAIEWLMQTLRERKQADQPEDVVGREPGSDDEETPVEELFAEELGTNKADDDAEPPAGLESLAAQADETARKKSRRAD